MSRPLPPPLEVRCPDCPICGTETDASPDNTFDCQDCGCSWPRDQSNGGHPTDDPGEWNDPDADRCPATTTSTWWAEGVYAHCLLTAGHGRMHYGAHSDDPNAIAFWITDAAAAPAGGAG
jgi:hypothetical protein